ncbi:MAG: hypothetical protein AAF570_05460, partial [Bacteroidota bacterium]
IIFESITSEPTEGTNYELIAQANLRIMTDNGWNVRATPIYRIDKNNRVSVQDHLVEEVYTSVACTFQPLSVMIRRFAWAMSS